MRVYGIILNRWSLSNMMLADLLLASSKTLGGTLTRLLTN